MKKVENHIQRDASDDDEMLEDSDLPGQDVSTGNGATIYLNDDGSVLVDFGPCQFCGQGHYVSHNPNALFGVCDHCGAI